MAGKRKDRAGQGREVSPTPRAGTAFPPFRLAAGLGDPDRERRVLSALAVSGDIVIAERCLSADQLVAAVQRGAIDAVLVAADLHRLTGDRLDELVRSSLPLVVLAPDPDDERWHSVPVALLSLDADAETVYQALLAVIRGEHPRPEPHGVDATVPAIEPVVPGMEVTLAVIAVASGHGSPGRTTVAISLAAALGAVAPTILVDADLSGPSVAACLDADPTRNLSMLVHAEPETPREWDRAIAQEVQPLHPRSPHGVILCGVPKPAMRSAIPVRFFEQLVAELRQRYRYVVLDVGPDLPGSEAAVHRSALALAQQVLFVTSADVLGLWHTRVALGLLQTHLDLPAERVALVINRHDRRYHHGRSEIEWALGVPAAALVPYDHHAIQRALAAQHPLILGGRSRAGRALVDLAERVHGGRILLPPEARETRRRWRFRLRMPDIARRHAADTTGVSDGDYATHVS